MLFKLVDWWDRRRSKKEKEFEQLRQTYLERLEKKGEGYVSANERLQQDPEKHLEQGSGRDP